MANERESEEKKRLKEKAREKIMKRNFCTSFSWFFFFFLMLIFPFFWLPSFPAFYTDTVCRSFLLFVMKISFNVFLLLLLLCECGVVCCFVDDGFVHCLCAPRHIMCVYVFVWICVFACVLCADCERAKRTK